MAEVILYPKIAPVQKGSWRWLYYEGILVGTIVLHASVVFVGAHRLYSHSFTWPETLGLFFSASLVAIFGHNASHEIEHRKAPFYRKLLGFFYAYNLFLFKYKGHVKIHHNPLYTATENDADSSALKNISYFHFIKINLIESKNELNLKSNFKILLLISILFLSYFYSFSFFIILNYTIFCSFFGLFIIGIGFYYQHYGLRRKRNREKYEPYSYRFTWDCHFIFSNFLTLNLPRHAHHHDHQGLHYYELKATPDSPQFPYGYITALVLALIPPLWFRLMNPKVDQALEENARRNPSFDGANNQDEAKDDLFFETKELPHMA